MSANEMAEFNDNQRAVFCVFSGQGVRSLRHFLNSQKAEREAQEEGQEGMQVEGVEGWTNGVEGVDGVDEGEGEGSNDEPE